jgi:hypothetical protein
MAGNQEIHMSGQVHIKMRVRQAVHWGRRYINHKLIKDEAKYMCVKPLVTSCACILTGSWHVRPMRETREHTI